MPPTLRSSPALRRSRLWLLAPGVALAVFLVACSAGWLYARARIDGALDARIADLRRTGWTATADDRRWSGFPFRLKLTAARAALVAPCGWGVEVRGLQAQAVIFDPGHWVFAAPLGLVIDRGGAGPLQVRGRALSASVSGVARRPWRVAAVGEGLELAPAPGARPTAFRSFGRWEAYLRPAPDGSGDGEALWQVTAGVAAPRSLVRLLAQEAPVAVAANARITRLAAASGDGWAAQVRAWATAGGAVEIGRLEARGAATRVSSRGGVLTVGADGRFAGALPIEIDQAAEGSSAPVSGPIDQSPGAGAVQPGATRLVFEGGVARLGGLKLGPAPRIY